MIALLIVVLLVILFGLWALVRSGADADLKMEELMDEREAERKD